MIISNLDHLEVVEETSIIGGGGSKKGGKNSPKKYSYKLPTVSVAVANGEALAIGGKINVAFSDTKAATAPGVAAASSTSVAASIGK